MPADLPPRPNLEQLIADCIDSVAPIEREVRDREGRWYSLRIRPYKNLDNRIDGAILALFDADAPRRLEERLNAAVELVRCTMDVAANALAVLDADLLVMHANADLARLVARPVAELKGQSLELLLAHRWSMAPLIDQLKGKIGSMRRVTLPAAESGGAGLPMDVHILASHADPAARALLVTLDAGTLPAS